MEVPVEVSTQWLELSVEDSDMRVYQARPARPGSWPGVVLLQEIFGVNGHIRDVCERLAAQGYVVVAPDIYHRTDPGVELDYQPADIAAGKKLKASVTGAGFDADLDATLELLRADDGVRRGPVGILGFCFGGHLAFRAAADPRIGATASFYGAGIPTTSPGGGAPTVTRAASIRGRILCLFGGEDPSIPREHVDLIGRALGAAGVDHEIVVYPGVRHGFFCDQRAAHDPAAAADAWRRLTVLFAALR